MVFTVSSVKVRVQRGAVYSSHMLRYSTEKSIKWRNPVSPTIRCKSAAARVKIKFILKINGAVTGKSV